MKPNEIEEGKTYTNNGAETTQRTVIAIGAKYRPSIYFNDTGRPKDPTDPGVLYEQNGKQHKLYLKSFAAWAGREVAKWK